MILGTRGSAQQSRRGYAEPALPLAQLNAEPAAGIVPFQRARGCDCEVPHSRQAAYSTEKVPSGSSLYTWAGQQATMALPVPVALAICWLTSMRHRPRRERQ